MAASDTNAKSAALAAASEQMQILSAGGSFCFCSVGMLLFNKYAISAFPLECSLVSMQLAFASVALLLFAGHTIHIGSFRDLVRWCAVIPFFSGMLLTSILALKNAPMSLLIVLRCMSPLCSMIVEQMYPEPLPVTKEIIASIVLMTAGGALYVRDLNMAHVAGVGWVILNAIIAVCDRCLQRLFLAKENNPVDISKTGATWINNTLGLIPVLIAAYCTGELGQVPAAWAVLSHMDMFIILMTCVIGLGICYTGIWAQSLISATSFLVMINANKFVIIFIEFCLHAKVLTSLQACGACLAVGGACVYGFARQAAERVVQEKKQLLPSKH